MPKVSKCHTVDTGKKIWQTEKEHVNKPFWATV